MISHLWLLRHQRVNAVDVIRMVFGLWSIFSKWFIVILVNIYDPKSFSN